MRRLLFLALAFLSLASCQETSTRESEKTTTTVEKPKPQPQASISKPATDELMNLLLSYYSLKDALVASDGAKADDAASRLMSAAELFHSGMGPEPRKSELQQQLQVVMDGTEAIMALKADSLEAKRRHFSTVSDAVFQLAKLAELHNAGVYRQFCPMALNDKGAYWLSPEEEIKNPYFGNKMLECGEVQDSL